MPLSPKNLEDRIAAARDRATHEGSAGPGSALDAESYSAMSFGLSAGAQFVAAVVGGGGFGWVIDRWLGTSPFGLLILMIVCFVAALVNVWLTMSKAVDRVTAGIASGEISAEKQDKDTEEVDGESS